MAPVATDAVAAPVPTLASTKVISPPVIAPDVAFDNVTTLPDIELTVVLAAIFVPKTESPAVIPVTSATVNWVLLFEAVPVVC